jgi:hypothetical protein
MTSHSGACVTRKLMLIAAMVVSMSSDVWCQPMPEATSGFTWPLCYNFSNNGGWQFGQHANYPNGWVYHPGEDWNVPGGDGNDDLGSKVMAVADGWVVDVNPEEWGGLVIEHSYQGQTWFSQYGHVQNIVVGLNQIVRKGQIVAEIGMVGTNAAHLHFEIREWDHPDPTNGSYWNYSSSGLNNLENVNNWYEDPDVFIPAHPAYGAPTFVGYFSNGWHNDGVSQQFVTKNEQQQGINHALGCPWSNGPGGMYVHEQNGMYIQDFFGPYNNYFHPYTALIRKIGDWPVCVLKEGFWDYWMDDENVGWLNFGAPVTDEDENDPYHAQMFFKYPETHIFRWVNNAVQVEDVYGVPIVMSNVTFTSSSLSRDTDGVYHSGISVAPFGIPVHLVNGSTFSGLYGLINNEQVNIAPFTVNGDTTIMVNGCGLPYPTGVSASEDECFGVVVEWDSILPSDEYYYRVLRNGVELADYIWWTTTSFSDTQTSILIPGVYYNYSVQVRLNEECISDQSLADPGRRFPAPTNAPSNCVASDTSCNGILVTWMDNSDNESGFYIYRDDTSWGYVGQPNATSWFDDLTTSGTHTYKVQAQNFCGWSPFSNYDSGTITSSLPPVPWISATTNLPDLTVTWQDIAGESGYVVLRSNNNNTFEVSGMLPPNTTTFADPWAYPEVPYLYRVRAVNGDCATSLSSQVLGSRLPWGGCVFSSDTAWTKTWNVDQDSGRSIAELDNGDLLIVGTTELSFGQKRIGLVHTDANGNPWLSHYFASALMSDEAYALKPTQQGFVIAGRSETANLGSQMLLVVIDNTGFPQTYYNFGGTGDETAYDVTTSETNGYVLVGSVSSGLQNSDFSIVKTTASGGVLENRSFGYSGNDIALSVDRTLDNGYIVAGYSVSNGQEDIWIIRLDSSCDSLWSRRFGGTGNERGMTIRQLDSGFLIFGSTNSYAMGGQDFYLIRTNQNGDSLWSRTYGGPYDDIASSMDITENGTIIMAGSTQSFNGCQKDMFAVIADINGNLLAMNEYGGNLGQLAYGCKALNDGQFLLVGTSDFGDFYGVKSASFWGSLAAPVVTILPVQNNVGLYWNNTHAPFYRVYSSPNPGGPFTTLESSTTDTSFVDTTTVDEVKKFYVVVSSTSP